MKSKIIVLSKLLNEKETNICPPSIGKKCINQKGFPRSFIQCFTPRIRYVLRALQYLNVSPNYTLIWQKEITEKNVNWNSFWIRGHGAKFFTLTRFPLFFFSLYKTFIYACWCYKTRILMWNTSVCPGPELETILAIPISLWNQLENEGGQWVHWGPAFFV